MRQFDELYDKYPELQLALYNAVLSSLRGLETHLENKHVFVGVSKSQVDYKLKAEALASRAERTGFFVHNLRRLFHSRGEWKNGNWLANDNRNLGLHLQHELCDTRNWSAPGQLNIKDRFTTIPGSRVETIVKKALHDFELEVDDVGAQKSISELKDALQSMSFCVADMSKLADQAKTSTDKFVAEVAKP